MVKMMGLPQDEIAQNAEAHPAQEGFSLPSGNSPVDAGNSPELTGGKRTQFKKGQVANPRGRIPYSQGGKLDRRTIYRQMMEQGGPAVLAKALELGAKGDNKIIPHLLKYMMPAARDQMASVDLGLPKNATIEDRLAALAEAVTEGRVAADVGAALSKALKDQIESAHLLDAHRKLDSLKSELVSLKRKG